MLSLRMLKKLRFLTSDRKGFKMIHVIVTHKRKKFEGEFPMNINHLCNGLQAIGLCDGPHVIHLTDNEGDDVRVKLRSDNDFGNHLLLLFNKNDTLEDVRAVVDVILNETDDVKEVLEEYVLYDQFASKEELYTAIKEDEGGTLLNEAERGVNNGK